MDQKSIYFFIHEVLETVPGIPYEFQNTSVNGYLEANYLLKDRFDINLSDFIGDKINIEILKHHIKEDLSKKLIDLIMLYDLKKDKNNDIREFLYKNPLYTFMDTFQTKFESYLNSNSLDRNYIYEIALDMSMNSIDYELTALGIILLGYFDNDFSRKIIETLGYHSMFTAYAVDAYKNFKDYNDLLLNLCKHTLAYGKAIALINFNPIKNEDMNWIIKNGGKDIHFSELCSTIILQKPEVNSLLQNYVEDENYLDSISHLLANGLNRTDFMEYSWTDSCFEKYIDSVSKTFSFMVLASYVAIEKNLNGRADLNPNESVVSGWTFGKKFILSKKVKLQIDSYDWKNIVYKELENKENSPELIISVLKRLDLTPNFESLLSLMNENKFNSSIADFIFSDHPKLYLRDGLEYTKKELLNPFGDLMGKSETKLIFSSDYLENNWLVLLLKSMADLNINDELFFLDCLSSKSIQVRLASLKCLENFAKGWSNAVLNKLESMVRYDSSSFVRREMQNLINIGKSTTKLNKVLDVSEIELDITEDDKEVFEVSIVGTFYHDLTNIYDEVKKGTLLYLIKKNNHGEININVTTESGYVIGYIAYEDMDIILPLIDAGNTIYGVFNNDDLSSERLDMTIMMNTKTYEEKGIIPFSINRLK
ncbi:MAG: hypothetical protein Q4P31_05900 [Andreesenia angusta]|nr:hypothetical protein [Andreesenia angusta]